MRTRRAEWEEPSASSSFDEAAPAAAAGPASGLVARMAVQRSGAGHPLNRSWSASDRAGPSPLSEASGPSGAHPPPCNILQCFCRIVECTSFDTIASAWLCPGIVAPKEVAYFRPLLLCTAMKFR